MLKCLSLFCLFTIFFLSARCQIKETIDRDIAVIKYVPGGYDCGSQMKKIQKLDRKYRKRNHEYHEILSLDTLAIPYLIDKISDTTETPVRINCVAYNLKTGDVAFALLKDIIIIIPMYAVSRIQWDLIGCDSLCEYMDYLHNNRIKFQNELRTFFNSRNGKIWIRIFKTKLSKTQRGQLLKELKFN